MAKHITSTTTQEPHNGNRPVPADHHHHHHHLPTLQQQQQQKLSPLYLRQPSLRQQLQSLESPNSTLSARYVSNPYTQPQLESSSMRQARGCRSTCSIWTQRDDGRLIIQIVQ